MDSNKGRCARKGEHGIPITDLAVNCRVNKKEGFRLSERLENESVEEVIDPARWHRLETVFDAALAVGPHVREQFLNRACDGDQRLQREVEALLVADETSDDLLQSEVSELCIRAMTETLKEASDQLRSTQGGFYVGLILKDRWKILSAMDEGGMGQVYLANDLTLNRAAVVKVLKKESQKNPWKVKKFGHEGDAQSRLKHANVASLYDKGTVASGEEFLVMEFIQGKTLRTLINDHRVNDDEIDLLMIAEIMKQAGRGVAAIHQAGLVHRDLKPENIMIQRNGDDLEVKIIDFGIVRVLDKSTVAGQLVGSVYYMAPEQLRTENATPASDIYALAVIAYELITGRRPFDVGNAPNIPVAIKQLLQLQSKGVRLKPGDLRSGLSPEADHLVLQGLSFEAKKRPEQRQFTEELARILQIMLPPTPTVSRKWWLVAAGVVLAGVLGLTSWGLLIAMRPSLPSDPVPSANPGTGPERTLTYWLTITRKSDGKKTIATGRETFDTGDEFRFNFDPSQAGALYVFNEGTSGNWHLLFPTKNNHQENPQLSAAEKIETDVYQFTNRSGSEKGTERIWLVWAKATVPVLDDVMKQAFKSNLTISDSSQRFALQDFLTKHRSASPNINYDSSQSRVTVKGSGDTLIYLLELENKDWK